MHVLLPVFLPPFCRPFREGVRLRPSPTPTPPFLSQASAVLALMLFFFSLIRRPPHPEKSTHCLNIFFARRSSPPLPPFAPSGTLFSPPKNLALSCSTILPFSVCGAPSTDPLNLTMSEAYVFPHAFFLKKMRCPSETYYASSLLSHKTS